MPKNKGKGGKNRRRGKNENEATKRELDLKEDGQEYGQVTKILGNGRVRCYCFDGKERLGNIRGKLRKKVWINTNDIVLLGLRDFQDSKADVIQKYNPDEARRLKAQGHIPDSIQLEEGGQKEDADNFIAFANENDDDNDLVLPGEEESTLPAPQPDRYKNMSEYNDFISDFSTSDEDSDDDDDDKEFEYDGYKAEDHKSSGSGNKKEINIDNI